MIVAGAWRGKRYAVLGLARSGRATVDALLAGGAEVVAWDDDEARREAMEPLPFRGGVGVGQDGSRHVDDSPTPDPSPEGEGLLTVAPLDDLAGFDALVLSPGVPLNTSPLAARARAAGVPIIGDIELFAQARADLPPHRVVGITGTNGKSTTTALVHHILRTAKRPSTMGGNIGLPILAQEPLVPNKGGVGVGVYVLELSSYQIDLTHTLDCDVAVLLNVTPDHLDRYDDFDAYRASKIRLLDIQGPDGLAVVASEENGVGPDVHALTTGAFLTKWFGGDYATDFAKEQPRWPALQGPHNAQNAWAARMTCLALGLSHAEINRGLRSYRGLPHRMERVRDLNGVGFVNDSKATNPESAAPALAAFERVHWIVGGRAKGDDLDACRPHLPRVARAYAIGEAGPRFADVLRGHVPVEESGTLARAVASAAAAAVPGDTVLLSPAAASFDQFRDFEHRGDAFRAAVEAL